jgi:hypothetical protein
MPILSLFPSKENIRTSQNVLPPIKNTSYKQTPIRPKKNVNVKAWEFTSAMRKVVEKLKICDVVSIEKQVGEVRERRYQGVERRGRKGSYGKVRKKDKAEEEMKRKREYYVGLKKGRNECYFYFENWEKKCRSFN